MVQRVAAVLVTHNRLALLRKSLSALLRSTYPIARIFVIDNQSTDGTAEVLAQDFPTVCVDRTETNIGSAGGYCRGIARAMADGIDWIWTLDDDSIAADDALAKLFDAFDRFPASDKPVILASKVLWTDGTLHPMNIQKPKLYNPQQQFLAAECGTMSIRFTSFVSMLIRRDAIEQHGLPIAEYFLWNDDVEWSARLLRQSLGVLVPASVVIHETPLKHVPATSSGEKFYYEIRNKLWICRYSQAFARDEKAWMIRSLIRRTWGHVSENCFNGRVIRAVARGAWHGLVRRP